MSFLKKYFLYFFIIFISSSIIFDWSDYAHLVSFKNSEVSFFDKYEEIETSTRFQNFENRIIEQNSVLNNLEIIPNYLSSIQLLSNIFLNDLFFDCKIKSHLHLLQLF